MGISGGSQGLVNIPPISLRFMVDLYINIYIYIYNVTN
jgi:hypothetical protein